MQSDLSNTPCSVIACTHELNLGLWHDLLDELGHNLWDDRAQDFEARDGHVPDERVAGLADWGVGVL